MGLNHIDACYQSGEKWDDGPKVTDGESGLFVKVLSEKGTHTRAIFGHQANSRLAVEISSSGV